MGNNLWNDRSNISGYDNSPELYQEHILEQYKLYVEMADRISSRRTSANVFFLTLNTTVLTVLGFLYEKVSMINPKWLVLFPLAGIIIFCLVWWWLIRSYKNLNSAKYKIIGQLEKKLPSSPYWSAEWKELGEGENIKKYLKLTVLENIIPMLFGFMYVLFGVYIMW